MQTLSHLLLLGCLVVAGIAFGSVAARYHASDRATVVNVSSSRCLPACVPSPRAASDDVTADEGPRRRAAPRGAQPAHPPSGRAAPRGSLPSQAPSGVSSAAAQIDESQDRLGLQTLEMGHHRPATHVDQPKLGRGENSVSVNPPPMRAPRVAKGRTGAAGVRQRQEAVGEPNSPPGVALRSAMRW
jgi:hypothetical protein